MQRERRKNNDILFHFRKDDLPMTKLSQLKIDPEFQRQINPPTFEEKHQLEMNILKEERVLNPIITWNGYIVDGHTRYQVLQKYPFIPFEVIERKFSNRYEALAWICKNQLGRRNLTPEQKKFLIGKQAEAEKQIKSFHGNQYTLAPESGLVQNEPDRTKHGSRSKVAAEHGTSESYVYRAEQFAKGVEAAEEAVPGVQEEILSGKIRATDREISSIAKIPKKKRPEVVAELRKPKAERNSSITDSYSSPSKDNEFITTFKRDIQGHKKGLNKEEKQWLDAHENTICVGYLKDNLPFCGEENGKLTGILGTVLDTVQEKYEITIKVVPCSTGVQMNEALQSGEIDIAGPIIQDFYIQEQFQVVLTDAIFDITPVVIYKGKEYSSCLSTIAVTETSLYSELMVSFLFPDAEIKQYDTQEECLEAVANGKVGATVIPSSKINLLNESPLTKSLSFAEMAKRQQAEASTRRNLLGSGDRSDRNRTYNFPQGRVTDHRINLTLYRLDEVMEGKLDMLIEPIIQEHQADQLAALSEQE